MTLKFEEIVVDCRDFHALGHWWEAALGWVVIDEDDGVLELQSPEGAHPTFLFLNSAEAKVGKNRIHFDFVPDDQAAEVERLLGMGARRVDIGQGDAPWVVLADPEGNEFCVLTARG
ncbi:glyoxalase [Subtercola sp. Z020]|uniref:VOC family protein n=1 Tax=Subtercola sp. Z020 TaxID=2080582 RepID=UPI000CE8D4BA|nr:VOC family protein [Subtercola sp. Z020]PPF87800.1 glyoxalase [Subtercola sp. Z020]